MHACAARSASLRAAAWLSRAERCPVSGWMRGDAAAATDAAIPRALLVIIVMAGRRRVNAARPWLRLQHGAPSSPVRLRRVGPFRGPSPECPNSAPFRAIPGATEGPSVVRKRPSRGPLTVTPVAGRPPPAEPI
eukprot:scaffold2591_cov417-Prasinococcus_capsulatus_cf.AAC.9